MKIPLIVCGNQYSEETVVAWQHVWKMVCDMCYNGKNIQEKIVIAPGYFQLDEEVITDVGEQDQAHFYGRHYAINDEELTLDYTWKKYSQTAGPGFDPSVVPQLKHLHVPNCLFYTLGVDSWFAHSFPNCKVTFWEH